MRRAALVAVVLMSLFALTSCSKNNGVSSVAPQATGQMQVMMTDAPATFDAVNLVISEVSANNGSGWQVLSSQTHSVDLLSLNNGVFANLAQSTVPVGNYNQIRLKLAEGSNVVVNGVTYQLVIPSGMQSGLKLDGSFDVTSGGLLSLQLDFDAAHSIAQNGSGTYSLNPVVRMMPASQAGAISGNMGSVGAGASVQLAHGDTGDLVTSTTAKQDGSFKMAVLPPGVYTLTITSGTGKTRILQDVVVAAGQNSVLGHISLPS